MSLVPATTIVYLWMQDILGNNIYTNASFSVRGGSFRYGQSFVDASYNSSNFDNTGFAQLQVVESTTPGVYYSFSIKYQTNSSIQQINFDPVMIPNIGAVNLCTIATMDHYY
jgi:hypothetical protein